MLAIVLWVLVALFTSVTATAQSVSNLNSEATSSPRDNVAVVRSTNVPDGFKPLAQVYVGWWNVVVPEYGNRAASGPTSLTIKQLGQEVSPADGILTFTAEGTYTSLGSRGGGSFDVCWDWKDAPMQLRWRQSEVIFLIIPKHPNPDCTGQRSFKLSREKSGRLTWRSGDGLSTMYYDPE